MYQGALAGPLSQREAARVGWEAADDGGTGMSMQGVRATALAGRVLLGFAVSKVAADVAGMA